METAEAAAPTSTHAGTDQAEAAVLLVEDSDTHALLVESFLQHRQGIGEDGLERFTVTRVGDLAAARAAFEQDGADIDAVLLDLTLPDASDLDALTALLEITDLPIVVMTGSEDVDRAVRAMRAGAQDYLVKTETGPTELARALHVAMERARMARDLADARAARDLAVTRLDDFLSLTAHEMLSPLTTVSGMGETLTVHWERLEPDARRDMVRRMTAMSGVVVTVAEQLLALAKQRAGEGPDPERIETSLLEALADAADMAGVDVELPLDDAVVRVDPDHLRVVLRNLLTNAHRYGAPPIDVTVRRDGTDVVVRVRDHGHGIAEADRDRLFTRWASSDRKGSHGLGLYLARVLVDANDGEIRYVGDETGAAFDVRLAVP